MGGVWRGGISVGRGGIRVEKLEGAFCFDVSLSCYTHTSILKS
jgi:hypothetical protein